jgi:hypothetical protein
MQTIQTSAVLVLALAGVSVAHAQAPSSGQRPCADVGGDSASLSQKLDQGGGVICPPEVDSQMKAPTPQTGKMPVIPPPGSPGGDQTVQPK